MIFLLHWIKKQVSNIGSSSENTDNISSFHSWAVLYDLHKEHLEWCLHSVSQDVNFGLGFVNQSC